MAQMSYTDMLKSLKTFSWTFTFDTIPEPGADLFSHCYELRAVAFNEEEARLELLALISRVDEANEQLSILEKEISLIHHVVNQRLLPENIDNMLFKRYDEIHDTVRAIKQSIEASSFAAGITKGAFQLSSELVDCHNTRIVDIIRGVPCSVTPFSKTMVFSYSY